MTTVDISTPKGILLILTICSALSGAGITLVGQQIFLSNEIRHLVIAVETLAENTKESRNESNDRIRAQEDWAKEHDKESASRDLRVSFIEAEVIDYRAFKQFVTQQLVELQDKAKYHAHP